MRIEIDTKNDTKEELAHLARMLMELSGSAGFGKPKHQDIFSDDSSPSGGLFNMFSDNSQQSSPSTTEESPGGMMSLFDSPSASPEENTEEKKDVVDELKIVPY